MRRTPGIVWEAYFICRLNISCYSLKEEYQLIYERRTIHLRWGKNARSLARENVLFFRERRALLFLWGRNAYFLCEKLFGSFREILRAFWRNTFSSIYKDLRVFLVRRLQGLRVYYELACYFPMRRWYSIRIPSGHQIEDVVFCEKMILPWEVFKFLIQRPPPKRRPSDFLSLLWEVLRVVNYNTFWSSMKVPPNIGWKHRRVLHLKTYMFSMRILKRFLYVDLQRYYAFGEKASGVKVKYFLILRLEYLGLQ